MNIKGIISKSKKEELFENLVLRYKNNQWLRMFLKTFMRHFAGVDYAITELGLHIEMERRKVWFDELAQNTESLSEEDIQSEDFIHYYFCTEKFIQKICLVIMRCKETYRSSSWSCDK